MELSPFRTPDAIITIFCVTVIVHVAWSACEVKLEAAHFKSIAARTTCLEFLPFSASIQGLIQCNVVLQAYADHGMTEELNVESASVYPTNDSLQWLDHMLGELHCKDPYMLELHCKDPISLADCIVKTP
ncbi:hypothetical protein POTOM_016362 [Populus tomentosa]|uniref:Uncharacterized protein n=1 Tax=Populus tomentosa TaxID=118781 RepID=A0A8X8A8W1_POPTO|nr:hypothetical protein POTOM_016361 [Populus tomentosa]KAG6779958.1 hypothetical protein POTOM_016362 [Populus tomentosa]